MDINIHGHYCHLEIIVSISIFTAWTPKFKKEKVFKNLADEDDEDTNKPSVTNIVENIEKFHYSGMVVLLHTG